MAKQSCGIYVGFNAPATGWHGTQPAAHCPVPSECPQYVCKCTRICQHQQADHFVLYMFFFFLSCCCCCFVDSQWWGITVPLGLIQCAFDYQCHPFLFYSDTTIPLTSCTLKHTRLRKILYRTVIALI